MRKYIDEMFACLKQGREVYLPSHFWENLNERNISQLEQQGLENLKRTVAQNYFTWVVGVRNDQFRKLMFDATLKDWREVLSGLPSYDPSSGLSRLRFYELNIFTRLLWRLAQKTDRLKLLDRVDEPQFGGPFPLFFERRLISQDLANSIIELYAVLDSLPLSFDQSLTICELGAGYGRNAYVALKAFPNCKYVIIDIPPALYIAQEYLAKVLPDRKIMKFSPFSNFDDVREQYEQAEIVFLLPHQAEMLPSKHVDLFVNISSLHEMTLNQVESYFDLIDKKTRGHFYIKQWKSFTNPDDGITISEDKYPYRSSWTKIMSRTSLAQPAFFEAIYKIN